MSELKNKMDDFLVKKFSELCRKSRNSSLTSDEITERKEILNLLLESNIMYQKDGCHFFTNNEHSVIFDQIALNSETTTKTS